MSNFRTLLSCLAFSSLLAAPIATAVVPGSSIEQRRGETAKDNVFYGDRSYSFGDYETARKYYEHTLKIDSRNIKANNRLAQLYHSGKGVARDFNRAIEY